MESYYDYKKFNVLYVDDEEKSLKYFRETFGEKFSVLTASNAEEGFRILKENQDNIAVLMTDQRMPGEKGIQLLEKSRQLNPRIIRMLVTAYSDLETAIESVNTGAIYKYVTKPWDIPQLEVTLKRGIEFFIVQRERDQLLREKMSALYNIMLTDRILSLGLLATGLSHHIRNSMVAVKTFLDLTPKKLREENLDLEQLRNPDFWKEYYQKVQGQMDRVARLLGELWESSEKPAAEFPDKARLREVVEAAHARVKPELEAKKIQVEIAVPSNLPELKVDGKKFNRLFELLLREEAVNLPPGGKIKFSAQLIGPKEGPAEVQIEMEDDGPGVSQEALRSLFDPFFVRSGNPQEFGIYLMTCFFIAYHHGGRVSARNQNGKGNVLSFTFPQNPAAKPLSVEERDFISKILLNESMLEKLMAES
ncbi:MAG TPA: hybrid sensor histidine kinase/response regulator [bacterium]|nr:hybrid sensor histidine kinase/response regulator [bacterium]